MISCRPLAVCWIAAVVATPLAAKAEGPNREADALFQAGKASIARGDTAKACEQFAASERLEPATGTLLNLADCEEKLGHLTQALELFREAQKHLTPDDFRVSFTSDRIASLAARVVQPPPPSPNADAPAARRSKEHDAGGQVETPRQEVPRQHEGTRREETPDGGRRTAAYVVGGVGVAGLIAGTVTGILTMTAASTYRDHCNAAGACDPTGLDAASTGRTVQVVSPIAFALGALAVGTGAYLLITSRRPDGPTLNLGASGAGASLVGTF
jgi:hypothetical protein